jgi:imidazolonepropionase-like amidohydrolase
MIRARRLLLLQAILCLTACAGSTTQRAAQGRASFSLAPGDTWIRDVTVVSSELAAPLPHAHVVVRGNHIAFVGGKSPGGVASRVTLIDGAGRFLVPGLIDGHVHLAEVPGLSREHQAAMPALVEAYYRQLPRSYLYFGFTTVVDLNVIDKTRVESIRNAVLGPAVFDCGNALALANGYPMVYIPAPQRFELYPNFLYDARQADSIPPRFSATEHSPEADVARVVAGHGVCVKAHYELGFDPALGKLPVPTEEMMRQVRDASHRHKLPLLLHANSLDAHRFAVAVGADVVAHGLWNWDAKDDASDEELPVPVRDVLDAERRADIGYMPTARVISGLGDLFAPAFLDDPHLARVLPPDLLAWYRTKEARWFANELAHGQSEERMHAAFTRYRRRQKAAAYLAQHGGRILFGSDTPSSPTYANPPGYNGYLELREMQDAGVSPRQILAAATLENARLFGLADRYGTIQSGRVANLLLLRDDPLVSTAAFDTIETVIVAGRVIPRATLAASQ